MEYLTSDEMAKVDRLAMGKYGVDILQMMENAGRAIARFVAELKPKKVVILYGKGNNGANGLAVARFLAIYGINIEIVPATKEEGKMIKHQMRTLKLQQIFPRKNFVVHKGDIIIDALLGYNIEGNPKNKYAELINAANDSDARIVSIDLPSGMNPDTGEMYNPSIKSDYILTLALPKTGLRGMKNLYLVDLGIPNELYEEVGLSIDSMFEKKDVVKIK